MSKVAIKRTVIVVLILFAIWNLAWFIGITLKYKNYVEPIPLYFGKYIKQEDGFTYNVQEPGYLRLTGNLGITKDGTTNGLIIWPLLSGGYKYGIRIEDDKKQVYEIYVDEKMNPLDKDDQNVVEVLEKNKEEVKELITRANKMWNLGL